METIILKVTGMTCGSCVKHVEKALIAVEGVQKATVDLSAGTAIVSGEFPSGASSLLAALEADGYPATISSAYGSAKVKTDGGSCGSQSCCCH